MNFFESKIESNHQGQGPTYSTKRNPVMCMTDADEQNNSFNATKYVKNT